VLLLILLFNMVGYRAWFYYAEVRADLAMEAGLDRDQYDETKLVALTVTLDNPYQIEQHSFERVSGEISFQGKIYKYVKRRIYDGKLVVLCIPDQRRMVLSNAKSDYCNAANNLPNANNGPSHSDFQKNIHGSDYINELLNGNAIEMGIESIAFVAIDPIACSDPNIASPGKPPQGRV